MKSVYGQPKWLIVWAALAVAALILAGCEEVYSPPVITKLTACSGQVGRSGKCRIECVASDPDSDVLTYTWLTDGGSISGDGSVITWTAPDADGDYTITVSVTDGRGGEATDKVTISVTANHSPVIESLTVTNSLQDACPIVKLAMTANIKCIASDSDRDALSYVWLAERGNLSASGGNASWVVPPATGSYKITVTVTDGKGAAVTEELLIYVCDCCCKCP